MVRLLDLLALRAEREAGRLEVLVGTPLVTAGLGMSAFWIRHISTTPFLV